MFCEIEELFVGLWGDIMGEVCDEVSQHLRLEGSAWLEGNVVLTEFDSPLGQSAGKLWLVKYALQGISSEDCDRMALQVWPQFAGFCDECECELLKLSVTSLGVE